MRYYRIYKNANDLQGKIWEVLVKENAWGGVDCLKETVANYVIAFSKWESKGCSHMYLSEIVSNIKGQSKHVAWAKNPCRMRIEPITEEEVFLELL